jgi:hypothetical protein
MIDKHVTVGRALEMDAFPVGSRVVVRFKDFAESGIVSVDPQMDGGSAEIRFVTFPDGTKKLFHVCYLQRISS